MAKDSSFDVVSEPDFAEVANAVDQTRREAGTRYDFRGHGVTVEWDAKTLTIRLEAPAGMVMDALVSVLQDRMARRNVSLKFLEVGAPEPRGIERAAVLVKVRRGIETAAAKAIQRAVKEAGIKVETQIQGDAVRVSGKNKDDLQRVIQLLKARDFGIELNFVNFR